MKTKFIICWTEISNGKQKKKITFSLKKAIEITNELINGTLFEKAKTDTVEIIDTESGRVITF